MARYALTIFLSAFLLFQVQPLIGKQILPWFGGSPAVWTTCMLFFQSLLLGGYAYAHWLSRALVPRRQGYLHVALLVGSLLFLPILPGVAWKPTGAESPTWQIMALLAATIGMPYFLLSSTGPLLQEDFRRATGRAPYRLYALSNIGSLLALLSYPFVFEPELTLHTQASTWSIAYALFVVCCCWCALRFDRGSEGAGEGVELIADENADQSGVRPGRGQIGLWLALSACGSVLLLATTNQVCQEVAVVPFLWVVPLAIYLLTFIVCFEKQGWYTRARFIPYLATAAALSCLALGYGNRMPLGIQLAIYLSTLGVGCMVCHGELVYAKPHPRFLTLFYLMISAGGALGGTLVALVAPRWFGGLWEYPIALVATCALAAFAMRPVQVAERPRWKLAPAAMVVLLAVILTGQAWWKNHGAIETSRNFYGLLRVSRDLGPAGERNLMTHGQIEHGYQYLDADKRHWPTAYYGANSGIGIAIANHPRCGANGASDGSLRIGVVGLGCGTLAVYGRPGDYLRFYEINPDVVRMCNEYFTYCSDSPAEIDFVLGDARVQLERELAAGQAGRFDVLAIDAFSSDAIPMHLLTRESLALYAQHLASGGLLCLHISNKHLDLTGVVRGLAADQGFEPVLFNSFGDAARGTSDASWVVLTGSDAFLISPSVIAAATPWPAGARAPLVWTDDFGSLRQVLFVRHH